MAGRLPGVPNKDKPYRDALRAAIAEAQDDGDYRSLRRIARAHLKAAAGGDIGAIREIADRLDGKVPQGHGQDEELGGIQLIISGVQRETDGSE